MNPLIQAIEDRIKEYERLAKETGELAMMSKILAYDRAWGEYTELKQLAIAEQEIQDKKLQVYVTAAQKWEERFRAGIEGERERIVKELQALPHYTNGHFDWMIIRDSAIKIVKGEE